mmetsp:Transcript_15310/g.25875  ORF Transcript_15310/g.25875 Transcript_15310/m.25875 type:complete len:87 (-) Transcript_15310:76-336(-)|eukprot:CAMPEP_0168612412 /NCGR_PEP_ID=MMETSP0449_2-20121227/2905_1 /TAXON_ID=1082188 /ORGANISM="Strombidium rassoulzadegani, Strain ras09" /LENGTH=86 /DNA_ID=CAMNT_0008652979 /DNA_START=6 /DNA_END=266 /DNA_ORIENTATION=-
MGISVSTNTNHADNSNHQQNVHGDNGLNIGGSVGGDSSLTSDLKNDGKLDLKIPVSALGDLMLVNLEGHNMGYRRSPKNIQAILLI